MLCEPHPGCDFLHAAPLVRQQQKSRPTGYTRMPRALQAAQLLDMLAVVKRAHSESWHTPRLLALPRFGKPAMQVSLTSVKEH
jgi:hypothetical protein